MVNKTYINSSGEKVLEYISDTTIMLDMQFILTRDKILTINMPYLKLVKRVAGNDIVAIRLIDFDDTDGIITLCVQELKSQKTCYLSANMECDDIWLWSLADLNTFFNSASENRILSLIL